jgi:hypothetical protein
MRSNYSAGKSRKAYKEKVLVRKTRSFLGQKWEGMNDMTPWPGPRQVSSYHMAWDGRTRRRQNKITEDGKLNIHPIQQCSVHAYVNISQEFGN